jgi:hypothetical protein
MGKQTLGMKVQSKKLLDPPQYPGCISSYTHQAKLVMWIRVLNMLHPSMQETNDSDYV